MWQPVCAFDKSRRGPFVTIFADGSGACVMIATDDGIVDGEDLEPVTLFDETQFSLYSWLPAGFETWGMQND